MSVDNETKIYQWGAVGILVVGIFLFLYISSKMLKNAKRSNAAPVENAMFASWYLMLLPNVVMSFCYLGEHIEELYGDHEAEAGLWCRTISFWGVACITALTFSAVVTSFVTFKIAKEEVSPAIASVIVGNVMSWVLGLLVGLVFVSGESAVGSGQSSFAVPALGPFQGLYCCVREQALAQQVPAVQLVLAVMAVGIASQTLLYFLAAIRARTERLAGVVQASLSLYGATYACWGLLGFSCLMVYSGGDTSFWLSALGAWFAKLNPVIHSIILAGLVGHYDELAIQPGDPDKLKQH